GESNTAVAAVVGSNGGIDADDLAVQIDQRTAAGAGVDGGVGLEELLDSYGVPEADLAAVTSADDAVADRLIEAKRAADGEHPTANFGVVAVTETGCRKVGCFIEMKQSDIAFGISPDLPWIEYASVRDVDRDLLRARLRNNVIIGEHIIARS